MTKNHALRPGLLLVGLLLVAAAVRAAPPPERAGKFFTDGVAALQAGEGAAALARSAATNGPRGRSLEPRVPMPQSWSVRWRRWKSSAPG